MKSVALVSQILPFAIILVLVNVAPAQAASYFVGYCYRNAAGWGPYGVKATISTINPTVPSGYMHGQLIVVSLSYDKNYYISLGYHNSPPTHGLRFYYEFCDVNHIVHQDIVSPTPIVGQDYYYCVVSLYEKQDYTLIISKLLANGQLEEVYRTTLQANPYAAVDIQAVVTTTTSAIRLDGTHFRLLKYYYTGRPWPLWSKHVPIVSGPYTLNQISHSEFTVSGGG